MTKLPGFYEKTYKGAKVIAPSKIDFLAMGATEKQANNAVEDLKNHIYLVDESKLTFNPLPKPSKLPKKKKRVKNERKELIKLCDQLVRTIKFKTESVCFITGVAAGRWNPQENPNGLQLSHFVTRTVFPLRWDLDNCHLTTAATNYAHENNSLPYTLAMIRHYNGNEILNTLNQKWQEYKITGKTMPTWQIREKRDELQATLDALNGERTTP